MSDKLEPCPVCGESEIISKVDRHAKCEVCKFSCRDTTWNTLSRAVRIAVAAEWMTEVEDIDDDAMSETAFQERVAILYHAGQELLREVRDGK